MSIISTTIPAVYELTGSDLMAVAELAQIRRTLDTLEDRQKVIRAALLERLDAAGATIGMSAGSKVLHVVESTRPNVSANKVRSFYPEVWEAIGTETTFRSIRLDAPSVAR